MNDIVFEPDAIELIDENNAMQGWIACVNIYFADGECGDCIFCRERFATEQDAYARAVEIAAARQAAVAALCREAV